MFQIFINFFAAKLLSTDHSNLKKAVVEHKGLLRSGAV
jgi:hypothetical protein